MTTSQYAAASATEKTPDIELEEQSTDAQATKTSRLGFLGPCRQIPMAWTCLLLATALFILTSLFANNSAILMNVRAVSGSTTRPISILRLLSGITDALLFASCSAAFERLQWVLVSRRQGISAAGFLSLSASTGLMGLLVLAFDSNGRDKTARSFAFLRLMTIVLCPALGIILMSDVTTRQVNYDFPTFNAPYGTGMSSFNGSLAPFLAIQVDRVFHSTMTAFLKSGEIAVDITSPDLKAMSCAQGPTLGRTPTCQRTVFMPGTVPGEFMLQNELPDADISMAYGLQGYVLDFGKGDENKTWQFEERECEVIGLAFGAVSLCIHNTDSNENEIQARMVKCPSRMAVASECLSNTSWHTNFTSMVTTSLNATFNWADVAYHRPNGSIAWYSLKDKQGKAAIPARELLDAYKSFALGATSFQNMISQWAQDHPELLSSVDSVDEDEAAGISELLDIVESLSGSPAPKKRQLNTDNILSSFSSLLGGTGGSGLPTNVFEMGTNPLFPIAPYMMLETVAVAAAENPAMSIVATDFLQNFLAIPLFWCQNLMTVRGTVQGIGGIDIESILGASEGEANELVQAIESLMGVDEQTLQRLRSQTEPSKLAFSRLGYEVQMGKLSLVAYIVLTALLLAGCFAALTVGSIERWAGGIPPTGPFGLCDNMTHLVVRVDGRILEENDWSMACSTTGTSELLGEMRLARVSLKRSVDGPQRPWLET